MKNIFFFKSEKMHKSFLTSFCYIGSSEKMHKSLLTSFSDKHDDRRTSGQRYRRSYIYPPLDKRYSPIISSICGPNKFKLEKKKSWKQKKFSLEVENIHFILIE